MPSTTSTTADEQPAPSTEEPRKGRRVVHITDQAGKRTTYPITALNEYDAMTTDPAHGADARIYETHVYWHAAGAPGDDVRDWLSTVTDVAFEVEGLTPTPAAPPA